MRLNGWQRIGIVASVIWAAFRRRDTVTRCPLVWPMRDMKRREFITLLGGAAAWPLTARAQQGIKLRRIGFLANDPTISTEPVGRTFLEGLREHGFVEGENIAIERRFAEGVIARSSELAAELVRLDVSLIVASGTNNAIAARKRPKRSLS
jgi:putative tryptophan/tyrosine transport system substrate-binding protein